MMKVQPPQHMTIRGVRGPGLADEDLSGNVNVQMYKSVHESLGSRVSRIIMKNNITGQYVDVSGVR